MGDFMNELKETAEESESSDDTVDVESEVVEKSEIKTADSEDTGGIIRPVEDIDSVVEMYDQFEDIKKRLLDKDKDLTPISGSVHINKSGWRKIATAFNVTTEIRTKKTWSEDGLLHAEVEAVAIAPNNKSTSGLGTCSSNESNFMVKLSNHPDFNDPDDSDRIIRVDGKWRVIPQPAEVNRHNLMAMAETRAKNRAISDLVGGGEVSAEEMEADFFLD